MSNSGLVSYTKLSPNYSARNKKIDTITIHHMAGNLSVESCGATFADPARQASSNYGVGSDGRIGLYVEEKHRSWCSGGEKTVNGITGRDNDFRAVTIEVANDSREPDWHVSDKALEATIALCVDICQRNGIEKLNYTGDVTGNLTMHKWFSYTLCPGPYLESKFPYIAEEVNRRLSEWRKENLTTDTPKGEKPVSGGSGGVTYRVQVGAYSNRKSAENLKQKIEADGFSNVNIFCLDNKLYRVQIGNYATKAEANAQLVKVKESGYTGFVTTLNGTNVTTPTEKKSIERIAQEVVWGLWGNGADRKSKLTVAGYDYTEVQNLVNKLMGK